MRRTMLAALALTVAACSPAVQKQPEAPAAETGAAPTIVVTAPSAGARVTSPLRIEGTAPGDWYFEAVFPARLVGPGGQVIGQALAEAQSEWMTEAPVPFVATLEFAVTEETEAALVLEEDMPSGLPGERKITIPVVLLPPS